MSQSTSGVLQSKFVGLVAITAMSVVVGCGDSANDGPGPSGDAGADRDAIADATQGALDARADAIGADGVDGPSSGDEPAVEGTLDSSADVAVENEGGDGDANSVGTSCRDGSCGGTCAADSDCEGGAFCWNAVCVRAQAVAAGGASTCALLTSGAVQCWGSNASGQLGNGSTDDSPIPVAVTGLSSGVAAIVTGSAHACALKTDGTMACWGSNSDGQLGYSSTANSLVPVAIAGLPSSVTALAAGGSHTCAVTTGGAVQCWGANDSGELGNNSTTSSFEPVDVAGLSSGVIAIGAGTWHTCALTSGGAVQCWGNDGYGQLGDNSTVNRPTPGIVSNLSVGVDAIAVGSTSSCAITTAGGALCWGSGGVGELGDDVTILSDSAPVAVSGLSSGVAALAVGYGQACALTTGGGLQCWGSGGSLGNNTPIGSNVPVPVTGLTSGVVGVASGDGQSCAVTTAGAMLCWGFNAQGQLGNDSTLNDSVLLPVSVVEP